MTPGLALVLPGAGSACAVLLAGSVLSVIPCALGLGVTSSLPSRGVVDRAPR
jgi:hypothetical protein